MPVGVSQVLASPAALRMLPASANPHPHSRGTRKPEWRCSTSRVAGALLPGETEQSGRTRTEGAAHIPQQDKPLYFFKIFLLLSARARALRRHGAEEIYLGQRARAQELRRRVGDGVDDGQRWAITLTSQSKRRRSTACWSGAAGSRHPETTRRAGAAQRWNG